MATRQQKLPHPPQYPALWGFWLGWFLMLLIMVGNLLIWRPRAGTEVTIPYTTFLTQVRADNVTKVLIVNETITGSFAKPFQWPQLPHNTVLPTPPQSTSASKTTPEPVASPPTSYTTFRTTVPVAVGDPTLLAVLETHKVVVDVASPSNSWLEELSVTWLPLLLLVGFFWWTGRQAAKIKPVSLAWDAARPDDIPVISPKSPLPTWQVLMRPRRNCKRRWTSYGIPKSITRSARASRAACCSLDHRGPARLYWPGRWLAKRASPSSASARQNSSRCLSGSG